jgi:hypothetical protein
MAALTADTILLQRYHLIAPVADRGLGETWEGVDARIEGRRVLIKVLDRREDGERKAVVARLQSLRMFRHPGALALTDHGVHAGQPFVVHDLPLWGSLATLLDRYRAGEVELPLDKVAALVARLAEVVQAGHEEPEALVHGALRPRAVLVADDLDPAQTVLLDAGLRDLASDPEAPKESAAAARCLTPEQFAGESVVPRTDTFALVLLVLEILRAPAAGVTAGPSRYLGRADVPGAVWDVLLLATRIPVTERPSVAAFADLLAPAWTAPPVAEPTAPLSIPTMAPPEAGPDLAAVAAPPLAAAPLLAAAPALADDARYVPRSSIPPGGLLGAMPSFGAPAAHEPIEFGERTVALDQAPGIGGYAPPADPLGSTRSMSPRPRAEEPVEFHHEVRTIVAFAARMQAVDDMLSTVECALPPELDDLAARFRAQMAASRRLEEAGPKAMTPAAPGRPGSPAEPAAPAAPAAVAAPAPAAAPAAPAPAADAPKQPPVAILAAVLFAALVLVVVLVTRR